MRGEKYSGGFSLGSGTRGSWPSAGALLVLVPGHRPLGPWPWGWGWAEESEGKGEAGVGGNGPQRRWAPSLVACFSGPPLTIFLGLITWGEVKQFLNLRSQGFDECTLRDG